MNCDDFLKMSDGMSEAQRCAAFDFLVGCLAVVIKKDVSASPEWIADRVESACDHGRITRK